MLNLRIFTGEMPNSIFWVISTGILLLIGGCEGCEERIAENVGNGNDDPEILYVETWGTEINYALEEQLGFGSDCLGTDDFEARVTIEVRTAELVNGTLVLDPNPYYEIVELDVSFFKNTGLNEGTKFEINVPETGAYGIVYEVELNECSVCCHGGLEQQCGYDSTDGTCEAGIPRLAYERVFYADNRPLPNYDWEITSSDFRTRQCICGCDVEC